MAISTVQTRQLAQYEIVEVKEVLSNGASCLTSSNATVFIYWSSSLPDNTPMVGEKWLITRLNSGSWRFVAKYNGQYFTSLNYGMTLNARSCIGREVAIVEDIHKSGIEEIYLTVAANNLVMWESDIAEGYGLEVNGDYVSELLKQFAYYGISVILVIDCNLWTYEESEYNQVGYDGTIYKRLSFGAAQKPIAMLVRELYNTYAALAKGVCISNFSLANERCDYNPYIVNYIYQQTGEIIDGSYSDGSDLEKMQILHDAIFESEKAFMKRVKGTTFNWSVSCCVDGALISYLDSNKKTGGTFCGLYDDFSSMDFDYIGVPFDFMRQSNQSLALRSMEYCCAYIKRFCNGTPSAVYTDVSCVLQYPTMFEMLCKYEIGTVVIGDYEDWRLLSDSETVAVQTMMRTYKIEPKNQLPEIGFVVSSDNRKHYSYQHTGVNDNKTWTLNVEKMAVEILNKLPHKLKVLFDSDVENISEVSNISLLIMYGYKYIDNDMLKLILQNAQDVCNTIFVGVTGTNNVVVEYFGQQTKDGMMSYGGPFILKAGTIDIHDNRYTLSGTVDGKPMIKPPVEDGKVIDEGQNVIAPILIKDRSSYLPIEIVDISKVLNIIGDLVLYGIGV